MIPVNTPLLDGNEKAYLAECIDSGWISSEGPFVERFEREFARRVQRGHAVAVSNGTAALELSVAALGIGPGDEVIMPAFTIISCAAAVIRAGATPVFADSEADSWNLDVGRLERHITPRTRAIMAVHIYGLPVDMDPLLELARRHRLLVIEDAAEAHGLDYAGRPCGSFGDISTFSFYPNKHVTTGEGGMLLTDDPALAERCRYLRNLCFEPGRRFVHQELGWNWRMSNLQAAVGVAQLEQLDRFIAIKRALGAFYQQRLAGLPGISLPLPRTPHAQNVYWVFGLVLDEQSEIDAGQVMRKLAEQGIGSRPFFWPLHEQPVIRRMGLAGAGALPVAEGLGRRGFYLPSGLGLGHEQAEQCCIALEAILG